MNDWVAPRLPNVARSCPPPNGLVSLHNGCWPVAPANGGARLPVPGRLARESRSHRPPWRESPGPSAALARESRSLGRPGDSMATNRGRSARCQVVPDHAGRRVDSMATEHGVGSGARVTNPGSSTPRRRNDTRRRVSPDDRPSLAPAGRHRLDHRPGRAARARRCLRTSPHSRHVGGDTWRRHVAARHVGEGTWAKASAARRERRRRRRTNRPSHGRSGNAQSRAADRGTVARR